MLDKEKGDQGSGKAFSLYQEVGETRTLFSEWGAGGRGEVLLVGVRREEGSRHNESRQRRGGGEAREAVNPGGKRGTSNLH